MTETPDGSSERSRLLADRSRLLADRHHCARLAMEALESDRLVMAAGFVRMALAAERAAYRISPVVPVVPGPHSGPRMVTVPLLGETRDETPRAGTGPTGRGAHDRAAAAKLDQTQHIPAPDSTRCLFSPGGVECWAAVYLDPATGWHHLDPEIDSDHQPIPNRRNTL